MFGTYTSQIGASCSGNALITTCVTSPDHVTRCAQISAGIIPPDYDHALAESKHLILEADTDQDGQLTKEEVLAKYDIFVGSQATEFGEALYKHDEF